MKLINSAKRYKAVGPYSQAIEVSNFLFLSGVIGIDSNGQLPQTLVGQVQEIFENIKDMLKEKNLNLSNVVKTTCFLVDMNEYVKFNEIYAKEFGTHRPARSTVQVARLPKDALAEIEVVVEINN